MLFLGSCVEYEVDTVMMVCLELYIRNVYDGAFDTVVT